MLGGWRARELVSLRRPRPSRSAVATRNAGPGSSQPRGRSATARRRGHLLPWWGAEAGGWGGAGPGLGVALPSDARLVAGAARDGVRRAASEATRALEMSRCPLGIGTP
eukprot:60198-Chlamydomonas_euryale.AAC.2